MEPESELKKVCDDVFRKIGRNILLIQSVEQILKRLIAINGFEGNSSGNNLEQRLDDVSKKTMGNLVREFHGSYLVDQSETSKKEVEPQEPLTSFSFKLTGDAFSEHTKKSLASVVAERNNLVHHFLQDLDEGIKGYDGNAIKGWKDADHSLEKQHEKLVAEYRSLEGISKCLRELISNHPSDEELLFVSEASDKEPEKLS